MSAIGKFRTQNLIADLIFGNITFKPQKPGGNYHSRRSSAMSYFLKEQIINMDFEEFEAKVNMLTEPYGNLKTYVNGNIFCIERAFKFPKSKSVICNEPDNRTLKNRAILWLECKDCFSKCVGYFQHTKSN